MQSSSFSTLLFFLPRYCEDSQEISLSLSCPEEYSPVLGCQQSFGQTCNVHAHQKKHSFKLSVTLLYFSNKLSDQSDTYNTYIYHSQSSFINTSVSSSRKSSGMKCVERFISLFVTIIIFIFLSGFFMLLFVRYIICT